MKPKNTENINNETKEKQGTTSPQWRWNNLASEGGRDFGGAHRVHMHQAQL